MPAASPDPRRFALPAALALAAALAACGPTPIATPMPAPYPGATGTSADPYPFGTPITPPPSPVSPTPAGVPVALTLEEAVEQALWLTNPHSEPRVVFSRFVLPGDILNSHVIFGSNHMYGLEGVDPRAPVIMVGLASKYPIVSIYATQDDEQAIDRPLSAGAIFDAASGKLVQAGGLTVGGIADPLATLGAIPSAVITPVRVPSPLPTLFVPFTPRPEPTSTMPLPDDLVTLLPSNLRGQPLAPGLVDDAVLTTLEGWPLLPGNRWVYQLDWSDDGVWSGHIITETVEAAEVLRPDLMIVVGRSKTTASPRTTEALARGWSISGVGWTPTNRAQASALWYVVHGMDVYSAEDIEELEAITRWVIDPPPTPTGPVEQRFGGGLPWIPLIRFPISVGDRRPNDELGGFWTIGAAKPVDTAAGRLDGCFPDSGAGNALVIRWYCPGIGLARHVLGHRMFQFNQHLSRYDISQTVDDFR